MRISVNYGVSNSSMKPMSGHPETIYLCMNSDDSDHDTYEIKEKKKPHKLRQLNISEVVN